MSLYSIATDYNGPLEAAHAPIDEDRYDLVECGATGQPTLDLSEQLRSCSLAFSGSTLLSSANEHVPYRHRL